MQTQWEHKQPFIPDDFYRNQQKDDTNTGLSVFLYYLCSIKLNNRTIVHMKTKLLTISVFAIMLTACNQNGKNPFLEAYDTPYGVPPFDKIRTEHYMPAFVEGMKQQTAEIEAIAENPEEPTFANTIEAMEYSGETLNKVASVFFNLYSADTNDELEQIAVEVSPMLSEHSDNITMNEKLFVRIKTLHEKRETLGLNTEQLRLLEETYRQFIRQGADLDDEKKARLREINKELGLAELQFGQNVLAETNAYQKFVDNEADLAGLPENIKQAAAEEAAAAGQPGKWLFTPKQSSYIPVLQYAENRNLRRDLLMAYTTRANHDNENDNKAVINRIMQLRVERAQLFGFDTPAAYILDDTMAKTPKTVNDFLASVWAPALKCAKAEAAELQKLMDAEGKGEKLEPWDWWFYAEKLRKQKYDLNEEDLKPYFQLENVRAGVFGLANKLYGLQFRQLDDMPVYNPDVEVFEVTDSDGSLIGVLYTDYFPRPGKRAGAWMSNLTDQYVRDGVNHRPVIINVGNFTKPMEGKPSLLTMDEVETMFHEFGHALHGLLSQCTYKSLSGTNVARDFVELPSQLMENWCYEPEVMRTYAKHYQTGEIIPDSLIEKIQNARKFNQGFVMTELLSASILDMDWHMLNTTSQVDVNAFEKASLDKMGMIPQIIVRYRSTYFNHIFTTGYAAGYYSYTWAAVLDSDTFEAFRETGNLFNQAVATSFRKNVLERGNTEDPMTLYLRFRGKQPDSRYLLEKRGLL